MPTKKKTDVKLTPEIKAKLMGLSVVTDTVEYKLDIDVPEEFQPVFVLKSFTVQDAKKFKDTPADKQDEAFEEMVRTHLVGWRNLLDQSTGEMYEYKADEDGGCSPERYYSLPIGLRAGILQFLYTMAGLI